VLRLVAMAGQAATQLGKPPGAESAAQGSGLWLIEAMDEASLRVLVFGASLRADSLNIRLAQLAAAEAATAGAHVDYAQFADWPLPMFDGDLETGAGLPDAARQFGARLDRADALIIASPEYNASVPGALKNLVDWASRLRPQPFARKQALLLSASPSMVGGNRGLWALRIPLEHLGARVYPEMFSMARAHYAFGAEGEITDPELATRLKTLIVDFLALAEADVHYPVAKRHWVEFLGEQLDPACDRVE
jgi:chromate reductase, NAD(P)H dehydrogenase (quinone)